MGGAGLRPPALSMPQRVDLVLFDRVEDRALIEEIERTGVVWFER